MSTHDPVPAPAVVSQQEWLKQRLALLEQEKALTHEMDRVNAARRRLPMVRVDKDYVFEGPQGKVRLPDLFEGRRQLIVYHFMFDPEWDQGCSGCTGLVDAMGDLSLLNQRDTTFVAISRAPFAKLAKFKAQKDWDIAWYSSFGSDFNYDFHATLDERISPVEYNFRDKAELERLGHVPKGEAHALSVFFRVGDDVFHTYSTYARGAESLTDSYALLDRTPYGRQEDFEDSPAGWPQKPTYG